MARRALLAALGATLAGCFFDPSLGEGRVACGVDGTCPDDYTCGGDDRCYPAGGASATLRVTVVGDGRVTSTPAGVDCPGSCEADVAGGVAVVLTAQAQDGARFVGWSGCAAKAGASTCVVVPAPGGVAAVTATFEATGGPTLWAARLGGPGIDELYGVASATRGAGPEVVVGGGFNSAEVAFGPSITLTNTAADFDDLLVGSYALEGGTPRWATSRGDASYDNTWDVATDLTGRVFIGGYIDGTVDFGGGARMSDHYDAFVVAYDKNGAYLWDRVFVCSGRDEDEVDGVQIDEAGDLLVVGTFEATCDFGDGVVRDGKTGSPFVVKLDADTGAVQWARHFQATGGGGKSEAFRAAATLAGDVVVGGSFRGALDVGPAAGNALASQGLDDAYVVELDGTSGATLWARRFGGPGADWVNGVAVDGDGNVYATGRFEETVTFVSEARAAAGLSDAFLVKLSSGGTPAWDLVVGGPGDDDGYAVATDYYGNDDVLLCGGFNDTVDFGGGFVYTAMRQDAFVARFAAAGGAPLWVRRIGAEEDDVAYDVNVAAPPAREVLVVGSFKSTVDFGGGAVMTSAGEQDGFTVVLAP